MQSFIPARVTRWALVLLTSAALAACTMDKTSAPALSGPSEFGLSMTMTATPDVLERDGTSQSVIGVVARDASGKPIAGQRFSISISPLNAGTLTATEMVTDANGRGTVGFITAGSDVPVTSVTVNATPIGDNRDNSRTQRIVIALRGANAPSPTFTFAPSSPKQFDLVTFDASATTLDNQACHNVCTFNWTFGNEGSDTGEVVTHRFEAEGTQVVTLTVIGPGGVTVSTRKSVTVTAAPLPEAKFSVSPTDPMAGEDVFFNASASVAKGGARIVGYTWDFGNGESGSGVTAKATYPLARGYTVTLTVRDSNGLTATSSVALTVK